MAALMAAIDQERYTQIKLLIIREDTDLDIITKNLLSKRDIALNSLDENVKSLSSDIETRLSI